MRAGTAPSTESSAEIRRSSFPPRAATLTLSEGDAIVRRRLLWLMAGRLLVATLLLGGTMAFEVGPGGGYARFTPRVLIGLIVATFAASVAFAVGMSRSRRFATMAVAQVAWDVGTTTVLVFVSGAAASIFSFLYGITILMAALVIGPRAARVTSAFALVAYASVSLLVLWRVLPYPPDQPESRYVLDSGDAAFSLLTNLLGLVVVTALAGTLAERLRRAGGELARAAENAAMLERLNDDIVRCLTSGLVSTDLSGRIVAANPAAAATLGSTAEALVGQPLETYLPSGPDTPATEAARAEALGRRRDGSSFPVELTRAPLRDADGRRTGTLVLFQDLTELAALRETTARAERLAALGRVAAGLAHEIRNPLSSISGSVQLVRESEDLNDEEKRLLGIVLAEVDRLNDLVTTILALGKPKPPTRTEHDLRTLVEGVAGMARRGPAVAKQARIEVVVPPAPIRAVLDADQMRQVLWNLLKNALHVSPRGGVVQVEVGAASAGHVFFEVRDEGPGIAAKDAPHLFETFYSGHSEGIGIGLALVRQLVEAHGGVLDVSSAPGRGAVFRVVLPTAPAITRGERSAPA